MKKIIQKTRYTLIFSIVLLVSIFSFILLTGKTNALAGARSFVVLSGSMSPTIPTGSVVFTLPSREYGLGDVITFKKNNDTITHRVISYKTQNNIRSYVTKGDANTTADLDLVSSLNVVGKTVVWIPYVGSVISFLKEPRGFFLFLILPSLILIIHELFFIKKEFEQIIEKKVKLKLGITQ